MRVSGYKSSEVQGLLFTQPLGNHGHVRTVVGDLAEKLTCKLVGGRRHKTQSTAEYCPDVSDGMGTYYESKATGQSKQAFIYGGRLEKDKRFVAAGYNLSYVIWQHNAETKQVSTVEELRQLVLQTMLGVHVVPFQKIADICGLLPVEKLNSKYGEALSRPGTYGTGYRINLSLLKQWFLVPTWLPEVKLFKEL